jgi:hypothetical protein
MLVPQVSEWLLQDGRLLLLRKLWFVFSKKHLRPAKSCVTHRSDLSCQTVHRTTAHAALVTKLTLVHDADLGQDRHSSRHARSSCQKAHQ